MHVRTFLVGLAASTVALSTVVLTASPASATSNPQPDDTTGTPTAAALVGVGSDTSQGALKLVGDAYNATSPANRIFTYAACATPATCGTITMPSGAEIARPNGSGGGKSKLYGAGNDVEIDFARSSSTQSTNENNAGLQSFPFALDVMVTVTSGNVASNAPANLTRADLLKIYEGTWDNWNDIPGSTTSGAINPLIPQENSGTRNFFVAQLAEEKGSAVNLAGTVVAVQEHDPALIQNDANAIAPYSKGRAGLSGTALRVETGFEAKRALYNVVRGGAGLTAPGVQEAFGENGFLCSPAATAAIEAAGFQQLSKVANGGKCGEATQAATTNFTTSIVNTTTTVTVTSASASSARVVARVTAGSAPNGRVSFFEGSTPIASNVPLVSGAATITPAAAPGVHTYRAVFTPSANSSFQVSEATGTGTVQKANATISETFDRKVEKGKKAKGSVTVALTGVSAKASGQITVKEGKKTIATKTLANGTVTFKLPKLPVGKHTLVISWPGDANGNAGTLTFKLKVKEKAN